MEYLAELIFVHCDLSLIPLLTNEFSLNHSNYRPQTKLRKGYVFTPVCQSVTQSSLCGTTGKMGIERAVTLIFSRINLDEYLPLKCVLFAKR